MRYVARATEAHNLARRRILELMEERLKAGDDRVPGLRGLSRDLGFGVVTVSKALKRLAMEGRVKTVPRKGSFFVAQPAKVPNVCVVLGDEHDYTYVVSPSVLSGVMGELSRGECHVRIFQAADRARVETMIQNFHIDGCLWYLLRRDTLPKLLPYLRSLKLPLVAIGQSWLGLDDADLPPVHVSTDSGAAGRLRAEFLLRRGHLKIARLNFRAGEEIPGPVELESFVATLAEAGASFPPEWNLRSDDVPERLPKLLDAGEITAAVVNGGLDAIKTVLEIMDRHPRGRDVELLVDHAGSDMAVWAAAYPNAKISGYHFHPDRSLGIEAARLLLDHLHQGAPLKTRRVLSEIVLPEDLRAKEQAD